MPESTTALYEQNASKETADNSTSSKDSDSQPVLAYRTGTHWQRPAGPEVSRVPKEMCPVGEHPITDSWRQLGPQVCDYLDSIHVMWISINVIRFVAEVQGRGPPVILIGVKPGSLSSKDAEVAAVGCEELLNKFELTDVDVAFRESVRWP